MNRKRTRIHHADRICHSGNTKQEPYGWYPIQHYGCMSLLAMLGNYIFSEGNSGMDAAQIATNGMPEEAVQATFFSPAGPPVCRPFSAHL